MSAVSVTASPPARRPSLVQRFADGPALWLIPVFAVIGVFYLYPILDALRLAFTDATLLNRDEQFSLQAFSNVFSNSALGTILRNTAVFTTGSVICQQLFGLAIALLVVRGERNRLPGMLALRTIVLAAWVIPGVANGIVWSLLFNEAPFGAINSTLRLIGIGPVAWLSNPTIAMGSAVIASVWQGTAFSMIVLYAAIKGIDSSLYEAAEVDGATAWERFWFITLPQLRPAILVNSILITIQTLNSFDAIIALTGGGPGRATEVLSLFTYNTVFYSYDLAEGSVLSIMLLLISLSLALLYMLFMPRREDRA